MRTIKLIASVLLVITMIIGLCLMITETPVTAGIGTIIKVNGGGAITFCVSLLILSKINKDEISETETKGGKYYGI